MNDNIPVLVVSLLLTILLEAQMIVTIRRLMDHYNDLFDSDDEDA